MAGITTDTQAEDRTSTGQINTHGYFQAPNGTDVTITVAAIEGLTVGSGSTAMTAVVACALLDGSNAQLATAQRTDVSVVPV